MKRKIINILVLSFFLIIILGLISYLHFSNVWDENKNRYIELNKFKKIHVYEIQNKKKYEILAVTDSTYFQELKQYYDDGGILKFKPINFPFKIIKTNSQWKLTKYLMDSSIVQIERIKNFKSKERYSIEVIWVDVRHIHFIK